MKTESSHIPACLLKEWLRELAEPLIPDEFYQQCVDVAKDEINPISVVMNNVVQIFETLPPLTKSVIIHLFGLLVDVIKNKEVTRMTTENIAIVFAPSFLR